MLPDSSRIQSVERGRVRRAARMPARCASSDGSRYQRPVADHRTRRSRTAFDRFHRTAGRRPLAHERRVCRRSFPIAPTRPKAGWRRPSKPRQTPNRRRNCRPSSNCAIAEFTADRRPKLSVVAAPTFAPGLTIAAANCMADAQRPTMPSTISKPRSRWTRIVRWRSTTGRSRWPSKTNSPPRSAISIA